MTKRALKELYRKYITGTGSDQYKMPNGKSWETMIPSFAFGIPENEREAIHSEWYASKKAA